MKKVIVLMATAFLFLGLAGTSMALSFGTSEYEVVLNSGINWDEAKAAAEAYSGGGWHLVTITSQAEQNFIADTLIAGSLDGAWLYWAGASQAFTASSPLEDWSWVTGEAWSFTAWANDMYPEPNDWPLTDDPATNTEMYLALDGRTFSSPRNWTWSDNVLSDSSIHGYVIERSVPEPATMLLLGTGLFGIAVLGRKRLMKK